MSEYQRSIDHVVALLHEEIDRLECIIDELSEDSPVGPKFDLEQTCFKRLLEYALEEQKKLMRFGNEEMGFDYLAQCELLDARSKIKVNYSR